MTLFLVLTFEDLTARWWRPWLSMRDTTVLMQNMCGSILPQLRVMRLISKGLIDYMH